MVSQLIYVEQDIILMLVQCDVNILFLLVFEVYVFKRRLHAEPVQVSLLRSISVEILSQI